MHPMLNVAVKAARAAGAIINRASNDIDKLTVTRKGMNDYVSEVDRAAEDAIISTLLGAYPDHGILAEESGLRESTSDYQWIIDPLDGTTNFLHSFPQYCTSTRNDLFIATRGSGAFLNERRIRVSKVIYLKDALIGTGFPYKEFANFDAYTATFKAVTQSVSAVRRPGSAALDLAYVACGRYDGFWESGLSAWDMAAGALLIKEAGGLITDFAAGDEYLKNGNVVAGTPKVFPGLLKIVQSGGK
jgi:myo-inositol-1(or 4)-monophosphatase